MIIATPPETAPVSPRNTRVPRSSADRPSPPCGWDYDEAFSRHAGLITRDEQQRLRNSRVAIAGMGGVGGIHLATLARLGIGKFTIADFDTFELANMNRQYGARTDTMGRPKAEVMADECRRINPEAEVTVFEKALTPDDVTAFLEGADVFVDGIDAFAIDIRRHLFRKAAERGMYSVTAGPMGFSTAWLIFDPRGMTFDRYFDFRDGQDELTQIINFGIGTAPRLLHLPYIDMREVDLRAHRVPSAGLACQLSAGVTAAEVVKILLGQFGLVRTAPCYSQFDAFRGKLSRGRMPMGNRNPVQRMKRTIIQRRLASAAGTPRNSNHRNEQL